MSVQRIQTILIKTNRVGSWARPYCLIGKKRKKIRFVGVNCFQMVS